MSVTYKVIDAKLEEYYLQQKETQRQDNYNTVKLATKVKQQHQLEDDFLSIKNTSA